MNDFKNYLYLKWWHRLAVVIMWSITILITAGSLLVTRKEIQDSKTPSFVTLSFEKEYTEKKGMEYLFENLPGYPWIHYQIQEKTLNYLESNKNILSKEEQLYLSLREKISEDPLNERFNTYAKKAGWRGKIDYSYEWKWLLWNSSDLI